ncbi:MAG TPA: hypothetical protein VMS56_11220 [Thermoanaerobaculia bacterium]|nr:hypothetical protein [Thermoanaerobaculia bacterium]
MTETPQFGPERDRRRRKRILTKRNVGIAVLALLVVFFAISILSELRGTPDEGFGRLYRQRTRLPDLPERRPYDVVDDGEVREQGGVDPLLLDGLRREQILGVEPGMLEKQHGVSTELPEPGWGTSPDGRILGEGEVPSGVRITGGPEGVKIERQPDAPPSPD